MKVTKTIHCHHDWQYFGDDTRYQVCTICGTDRKTPVYINTTVVPVVRPLSKTTNTQTEKETSHMPSRLHQPQNDDTVDNILGAPDKELSYNENAEWVQLESLLYQVIVIERAITSVKWNEERNANVERAIVTFHYADDTSKTKYVFSSGWPQIKKQVHRFELLKDAGKSPFPIQCGVIEILSAPLYMGQFPKRFAPESFLERAENESIERMRQEAEQRAMNARSTRSHSKPSVNKAARNSAPNTNQYIEDGDTADAYDDSYVDKD